MASVHVYRWAKNDQRWSVAARYLAEAGYSDVSSFVSQMEQDNPSIVDWTQVPEGTRITLSYKTS